MEHMVHAGWNRTAQMPEGSWKCGGSVGAGSAKRVCQQRTRFGERLDRPTPGGIFGHLGAHELEFANASVGFDGLDKLRSLRIDRATDLTLC